MKITYSIRKEGKTIGMDDFGSTLTLNHSFLIDKEKIGVRLGFGKERRE